MKSALFASVVLSALALTPLTSTASLVGDSVNCAFGPGTVNCSSASATVGAGVEFSLLLAGDRLFDIDLSASSLTVTLVDRLALVYSTDFLVLSGLDFAGFPGGIIGLNLDLSSTGAINNVDAGDFAFTSNSLTIDFRGWGYPNNPGPGSFTVDFLTTDAVAVPEPGGLALTGLALTALVAVRRRTTA